MTSSKVDEVWARLKAAQAPARPKRPPRTLVLLLWRWRLPQEQRDASADAALPVSFVHTAHARAHAHAQAHAHALHAQVKPGKGPAFVRTTLKNLETGAS